MAQQYYEQNVVNKNIDERVRKTKSLVLARTICTVIALGVLLTSAVFLTDGTFMFWLGVLAAIAAPFAAAAIILSHINKRNNTEYDYVLDDECLKIVEIYFRQQRKVKHTIRLRTIESVGQFGSEGYNKAITNVSKRALAIVNYEDEQAIMYITYNTEKGKRVIFLEPDNGFIIALRRVVSAVTVFDKSVAELQQYIDSREDEE